MQGLVALQITSLHIPALWVHSQTSGRMASFSQTAATADAALVARIATGDERALGELYDRQGSMVYGLACAIVRDPADAEEVAADAFAQLWRSASEYDTTRGSVASWLSTITRSRALDRIRARQRRARMMERAATQDADGFALPLAPMSLSPDGGTERSEVSKLVAGSLAELSQPQRQVIEMAYFGGLSQSEIATQLAEPLGTVKTRMRAGMGKLRDALKPVFGEAS
jgi:RNA polymerase sigma-70 factor (ECF subfamily)